MPRRALFAVALLSLVLAAGALFAPLPLGEPPTVTIRVAASQFTYSPGVVRVAPGQRVRLELASQDVTHGLVLEGHDVSLTAEPGKPVVAEFDAGAPGRYTFYCSATCGPLHPFMVGELIVEPNRPLGLALALVPLAGAIGVALGARPRRQSPSHDITGWPVVRLFAQSRWPLEAVAAALLAGFTLVILAGFGGSPVGSHNAAVVLVWLVWWGLLKLALIPLGGRAWCAVCPLPKPGEWLQRGSILRKRPESPIPLTPFPAGEGGTSCRDAKGEQDGLSPAGEAGRGVRREWPRRLRGGYLAAALLVGIGVASAPILTSPRLTAGLLAGIAALSLVLALVYRGRAFCRYVCPVGCFVGLYSLAAPLGVRPRAKTVCRGHAERECLRGSPDADGCPWLTFPGVLDRNVECGLCLECLRACPKSNVGIVLRVPGADLVPAGPAGPDARWPRADEGFVAVVTLALGVIYTLVFLGPWAALKMPALLRTPEDVLTHAGLVAGGGAVLAPALWLGLAWLGRLIAGRPKLSFRRVWAGSAYALVPLGLATWIAFTVTFVLSGGAYAALALADPLGWGWNLVGLATPWSPLGGAVRPWLLIAVYLGGFAWSAATARRAAGRLCGGEGDGRLAAVFTTGLALVTGGLLWLGLG